MAVGFPLSWILIVFPLVWTWIPTWIWACFPFVLGLDLGFGWVWAIGMLDWIWTWTGWMSAVWSWVGLALFGSVFRLGFVIRFGSCLMVDRRHKLASNTRGRFGGVNQFNMFPLHLLFKWHVICVSVPVCVCLCPSSIDSVARGEDGCWEGQFGGRKLTGDGQCIKLSNYKKMN